MQTPGIHDETSARSSGPRIFSSRLDRSERRAYGAVTVVFILVFTSTLWPIHALFSSVRPFILGVPFSMFFLLALVAISFGSLLALYRWEDRHGKLD